MYGILAEDVASIILIIILHGILSLD